MWEGRFVLVLMGRLKEVRCVERDPRRDDDGERDENEGDVGGGDGGGVYGDVGMLEWTALA